LHALLAIQLGLPPGLLPDGQALLLQVGLLQQHLLHCVVLIDERVRHHRMLLERVLRVRHAAVCLAGMDGHSA
jgi:hypothetical protein